MKQLLAVFLFVSICSVSSAQTIYMTRYGQISFFSKTPMENIEAVNNEVTSMLNSGTGELVFAVLIKSFHFDRALMEEHFNENYLESTKFPKSTFQGKITNLGAVDFKKDGTYTVTVTGDLMIHGVKQTISAPGTLTLAAGKITAKSTFNITLADYKIEVPSLVSEKIAKNIEVNVKCLYEPKP